MANLENNYDTENNSTKDIDGTSADVQKSKPKKKKKNWFLKLIFFLFLLFFGMIIAILVLINLPSTQNWMAEKAIASLNETFKTKMKTEQVSIDFFGDVTIKGFKVTDDHDLDFINAQSLKANSDWYEVVKGLLIDKKNAIHFNQLTLKEVDVKVITYKGDSIPNLIRYINSFDNGKKSNKEPFQLDAGIKILNSKVSVVNQNSDGEAGKWLTATDFNLVAPKFKIKGINIAADIEKFGFVTERWGKKHEMKEFSGKLNITKDFLDLQKVKLYTDHSLLKGDIKFNLHNGSWQDFANKVVWEMTMEKGSYFSGYDISYFANQWDNYQRIAFNGKMKGTLNDFTLKNVQLTQNKFQLGAKDITFKNLLKGNFIIKTPNLTTDFTYQELKGILPTFIAVKLKNFADDFGRLKYNGMARVTPTQVYIANGKLNAEIGNAEFSQLYLTDYTTAMPKYKGFVRLQNLDTSVITKNDKVKLLSGEFNVDGRSFDVNNMVLKTNSKVSKIEILGKEINHIDLNGVLDFKKYTGFIGINDESIKTKINGQIDFSTDRLKADVKGNVEEFDLNYFSENSAKQMVSGEIDGRIAMSDLNDLELDSEIKNVRFLVNGKSYNIPEAEVKAHLLDGKRTVFVDAPHLIKGQIEGEFNLADLSTMIENGISKILVSAKKPTRFFPNQQFKMNFEVQEALTKYISPELELPNGANINGSYFGQSNDLILNINAEQLRYIITKEKEIKKADEILAQYNDDYQVTAEDKIQRDSLMVDGIALKINTTHQDKQIDAKVDRVELKDNVFRNVALQAENNKGEYLDIVTTFDYGTPEHELEGNMQSFAFNLKQFASENGDYVFDFKPTQVQINNAIWNINTNDDLEHSIVYEKESGKFLIHHLDLTSNESQLLIKDATFKNAKDFNANVEVKNFQIAKIFDMLEAGNTMNVHGIANGNANIVMSKTELKPIIDIKVKDIVMQDRAIGDLVLNAKTSETPNIYDVEAYIQSSEIFENNHLNIAGKIDNNPSSPVLDIKAEMNDFDIAFANQFVKGVFSNLRGKTNGTLNITGALNDLDYNGDIALKDAGLKLNFVGVDYHFDDTVINVSRGFAELNNIEVKDGRRNSKGTISGIVQFETLASMSVNLFIRADNLLLLNTTQNDFDLFWGRVYTTGTLFVDGPVKSLNLSTPEEDGMRILDNSVFTFNSDSSANVDEFKMLRFLKENEEGEIVIAEEEQKSGANMNVDFTASVGKGTTVNVLVGEDVGDISVRGKSEKFNFKMTREGNISMNGRYDVDNGTYLSKLQVGDLKIAEKQFQIDKGSSIVWDDNPMTPSLDITAHYLRSVSNAGEYLNMGVLPSIDMNLETKITQTLDNPAIRFDIEAIDVSSQVKEALASKLNQSGEKVMQFSSILLLDSFNVTESGTLGVDAASIAEGSSYNLILRKFSSVLNTINSDLKWDFNYVKGNTAYNIGDRTNANLSYSISPRLTVKGTLGIPITTSESVTGTNNNYYSKEFTAEYDVSKKNDGTLLLRGYTKPTDIGMLNTINNQTYGVGIAWSKNFDTIFKKKKNKKTLKEQNEKKIKNDSIKKD